MVIMPEELNAVLTAAEVARQTKAAEKAARKAYMNKLLGEGIDRETAKVMVKVGFEYGLVSQCH